MVLYVARALSIAALYCYLSLRLWTEARSTYCRIAATGSSRNLPRYTISPAYIADAIPGHGDEKKSLQGLYMTISDVDLVRAIDMMRFDVEETQIWAKK